MNLDTVRDLPRFSGLRSTSITAVMLPIWLVGALSVLKKVPRNSASVTIRELLLAKRGIAVGTWYRTNLSTQLDLNASTKPLSRRTLTRVPETKLKADGRTHLACREVGQRILRLANEQRWGSKHHLYDHQKGTIRAIFALRCTFQSSTTKL